jgi:hypothetical protein
MRPVGLTRSILVPSDFEKTPYHAMLQDYRRDPASSKPDSMCFANSTAVSKRPQEPVHKW